MALLRRIESGRWGFWCVGCDEMHVVDSTWQVNPLTNTISPSVLVTMPGDASYRCHSFVRDGKIEYLGDCSHAMAGKTVDMVEGRY